MSKLCFFVGHLCECGGPCARHLQSVAASSIGLADETAMKDYLLNPVRRPAILAAEGASLRSVRGADDLKAVIADRTFVCLHYWLAPSGDLIPCAVGPAASLLDGSSSR